LQTSGNIIRVDYQKEKMQLDAQKAGCFINAAGFFQSFEVSSVVMEPKS
jgi:hypothetical protein